ncbi:MAG: TatD family hydrolase [Gammaproteobacteria bacterium]|nr:TatD family hydrolase [Gammaproteobacteria bacterium]
MSRYIDIGVNLTNKSLLQDLDGVIRRADEAGVEQMVVTGTTLEESRTALELCLRFPDKLFSTAGIHPHHALDWSDRSLQTLKSLADNASVRAIGETGLDFNRNYSPQDKQIEVFHHQLELARKLGKPVFCHQRDAHDCFLNTLREYRDALRQVVVHCFTDSKTALFDYLDLDCHIGVTGWICDERRGTELQQLVKYIPATRMMLETDAPYLLPRDLQPKPASRINEPSYLPHIAATIARYQNKPLEMLTEECLHTTREFFGINSPASL